MSEIHSSHALQAAANEFKGVIDVGHRLARYELEPAHGAAALVANYQAGVAAYLAALNETVRYLKETESNPAARSPERDGKIANLWHEAGMAIGRFDPSLANRCYVKGQGWLDPSVWKNPKFKDYGVSLDDMRGALLAFNKQHGEALSRPAAPHWFPIAGVLFAVLSVGTLTYLLLGPALPNDRKLIFDVWTAVCLACSGAFIGGTATAKGELKIPYLDTPVQFTAIGGVAIFIVVLLLMVAINR